VNASREALVGLVIVAGVMVTIFGTLWMEGVTWGREQVELDAVFYEVGLIRPGNALKLRGVQVGRVREIQVDPSGEVVRVGFRMDEGIRLPPDAVVVLSPESMFGDWQAEIHSRSRFPYANYAEPRQPGTLPGHALPDISQLTHMADRISDNLAVLTERVGIAFSEETARNIASLIENVEEVTERLSELVSQQALSFTNVTDGVQRAAGEISSAAEQTRETIARVDALIATGEVASTISDLSVIAHNLRALSGDLQGTNDRVHDVAARADAALSSIEAIVERAEQGEGSVGRLLQDPSVAEEFEGMMSDMRELLVDIRENPRRYIRLSIF
jgi:phospholipid/cholesterol/gamma-HCH transport system substrate-binding protein